LTMYNPILYKRKSCRSCISFDIRMIGRKPYIQNKLGIGTVTKDAVLLVDTGASDALWLFDEDAGITEDPKNYFEDFLGLGLSGAVYGKRSKLEKVHLGNHVLSNVNVSYPDSLARESMRTFKERDGTLGSEILKRFTMIMDYGEQKLQLKRNKFFDNPFHYNMAGLVIEHDGMVAASEKQDGNASSLNLSDSNTAGAISFNLQPIFSFFLAPKYVVAEVRKGSPADEQGIKKGDEVISINGKAVYKYELSNISALFSSKSGRRITVVINRNGTIFKKKFVLKEVI
ncbi:MAG: PDZ domain-containing protein, partial [Bacteroidetes bacterium]|nr:PDZ domain-containing protein [Bacteroidota bacterium]